MWTSRHRRRGRHRACHCCSMLHTANARRARAPAGRVFACACSAGPPPAPAAAAALSPSRPDWPAGAGSAARAGDARDSSTQARLVRRYASTVRGRYDLWLWLLLMLWPLVEGGAWSAVRRGRRDGDVEAWPLRWCSEAALGDMEWGICSLWRRTLHALCSAPHRCAHSEPRTCVPSSPEVVPQQPQKGRRIIGDVAVVDLRAASGMGSAAQTARAPSSERAPFITAAATGARAAADNADQCALTTAKLSSNVKPAGIVLTCKSAANAHIAQIALMLSILYVTWL